jgi:putative peptidoglycan lipid II flippase
VNLLRAAGTVSSLTLLSRITGLARENLTATLFGASPMTDAFFVAFRLPNLLRRMFAEGAFSQAFVPLLAQVRGQDSPQERAQAADLINRVSTLLFWTLVLISLTGVIAAPVLVLAMASGLSRQPAVFDAAVLMTRWMFPYILLISMVALAAGILNTWRKFAVPAATPVLLNLAMIGVAWGFSGYFDPPVLALAAGVMLGGLLQLAVQLPALAKLRLLPKFRLNPIGALREALRDERVRRLLAQMAPAALAVSVAQISLILNTQIASHLAPGAVSWISYADRLMEFPTALLGVALGTVLLPTLASAHASGAQQRYAQMIDTGLRLALVSALPATLAMALLAEPLTALLFHYGRFGSNDVVMTARAVVAYSVGLVPLIAIKILAPGFYARQDVKTPVRIGIGVLLATQAMNLVLVPWLSHAGLAAAISAGAWMNAALLLFGLAKAGAWQAQPGWGLFSLRLSAALAVLGMACFAARPTLHWDVTPDQLWWRAATTLGIVAAAGVAYLITLWACGMRPGQFSKSFSEGTLS